MTTRFTLSSTAHLNSKVDFLTRTIKRAIFLICALLMPVSAAAQEAEETDFVQTAGNYYEAKSVTDIQQRLGAVYDGTMNENARTEAIFGEQGIYGVNHTTGAFEYTYPIDIPKVFWGPQVNLSIHYNSQHGNDFMGMGAYLAGLPRITRDSRHEQKEDSTEYFLLDGQKLVKDTKKDYYHCELEDYSYTHCITRKTSSGAVWIDRWETYLKDGTVLTFSNILNDNYHEEEYYCEETIADREKKYGALSKWVWPLTEIRDIFGNRVVIKYIRTPDCIYPETITYRMKAQGDEEDGMLTIEFSYSDREDYYVRRMTDEAGILKKLDSITVRNPDGRILKKYEFKYGKESVTGFLYLKTIYETGKGEYYMIPLEDRSSTDQRYNKLNTVNLSWTRKSVSFGNEIEIATSVNNKWQLGDMNGDGYLDLYRIADNALYVKINNGERCLPQEEWFSGKNISISILDFNKDGLPDVNTYSKIGHKKATEEIRKYYRNTGAGFTLDHVTTYTESSGHDPVSTTRYADSIAENSASNRNTLNIYPTSGTMDIDGDGLKEYVRVTSEKKNQTEPLVLKIKRNLGFGKFSGEETINIDNLKNVKFADVNMDGIMDLYWTGNGTLEVSYGDKKGFRPKKNTGVACGKDAFLIDINSDGYIDLADFRDGSLYVKKGKPSAFSVTQISFSAGNSINVQYKYKKDVVQPDGTIVQGAKIKRDPNNQQVVFKIYESD